MPLLVPRLTRIHGVAALLVLAGVVAQAQDQQPPRFRSGVEVVTVDVAVVDGDGRPVRGLRPADFVVDVDGQRRRVVSAQWIQLTPEGPQAPPGANVSAIPAPLAAPYSSNDRATGGRLIVLFVDRFNIRFEAMIALRSAIAGFLNRLQPSDRVALVVDGYGTSTNIPFTTDRERVRAAVGQIGGQRGLAPGGAGPDWRLAIRELLTGLKSIEAPKTVLFISEGFPTGSADEPLLADTRPFLVELEHLAAESRTIIYGLKVDPRVSDLRWQTQDTRLGPDLTAPPASSRSGARGQGAPDLGDQRAMPGPANAPTPDRGDGGGLYSVAAVTGGSMFTIVMKADSAFARIDSELSGYYLLGVEADPAQRDGKPHAITVDVARNGATVRSRRTLIVSAPPVSTRTPEEVLLPAFSSPTPMAGLPIRVSSVALRGPGGKDVQLMIHAEVGGDYTEHTTVVLGFVIADANDKIIQRRAGNSTIRPSIPGEPSALQVTTSVNLPPGDYTMKLAVADGDRVGSVEHPVHARLGRVGTVIVSDLVVGGATTAKPIMPPPIGATITTDYVQGIIEAYGSNASAITGRLDVAAAIDGPALATAAIATVPAGDDRAVLGQVLSIRDLRPGRYVLRAIVALPNVPPQTIIRTFERR
jgi:VWFA-related protein